MEIDEFITIEDSGQQYETYEWRKWNRADYNIWIVYEMKIQMQFVFEFFNHKNHNAEYAQQLVWVSIYVEKMPWLR